MSAYESDSLDLLHIGDLKRHMADRDAQIQALTTELKRFRNPWTVQIQRADGVWEDFAHDAPLTLADAESRMKEHQAANPEAIFRVVPWFNVDQRQVIWVLTADNAALTERILGALEESLRNIRDRFVLAGYNSGDSGVVRIVDDALKGEK